MDNTLALLQKGLRRILNELADDLATGVATDFPHYRNLVGRIEGVSMAERELLDLAEKLGLTDED